jgi:expansin (peptidoglycan-binding protein)
MPHRSRPLLAALAAVLFLGSLGALSALAQGGSRVYLPLAAGVAPTPSPAPSPTAAPSPTPGRQNPTFTGEGTYYVEADGDGNCMFGPSPQDLMVGAMNEAQYANADLCGAFVQITGPRGTITVRIVDRCPECKVGDIDLSPQAFDGIAERVQGRVPISWRVVSPPVAGTLAYRFKEGSSQWWTAVQVRNHRNPIAKFEYRNAAGAWVAVQRERYNYFVAPAGMGPGPYTFRVTDIYGNTLTDSNLPLREAQVVTGAGQFPVGP